MPAYHLFFRFPGPLLLILAAFYAFGLFGALFTRPSEAPECLLWLVLFGIPGVVLTRIQFSRPEQDRLL